MSGANLESTFKCAVHHNSGLNINRIGAKETVLKLGLKTLYNVQVLAASEDCEMVWRI